MTVNNIEITHATILATRLHFIDIHERSIQDAQTGRTHVNNLEQYIKWEHNAIGRLKRGEADNTLTFAQRALWIQTGKCIAILS